MNNFASKFKQIREKLGLSQKEIADILGVSQKSVSYWEQGRNEPQASIVRTFCNKFGINPNWLLMDKGEMFLNETQKQLPSLTQENIIEVPYYPDIYAAAGAGADALSTAPKILKFSKDFLKELLDIAFFHNIHIINAVGDSMEPTILSGDKLFILPFKEENHQIKEGGIYIITTPQGTLVKRIYPNPFANTITLKSDNPNITDITIKGDELNSTQIIGRVVGILRHT